jgi:hypothetical protein
MFILFLEMVPMTSLTDRITKPVIYYYFPKTQLGFSRHMSLADNLGIKAPSHSLKSRSSGRCPVLPFHSETSSVAATNCRSPIVRTRTPTWTAAGWKARASSAMPATMSSPRFDTVIVEWRFSKSIPSIHSSKPFGTRDLPNQNLTPKLKVFPSL